MKSPARPKRNQVITELRTALESVTAPVVQDADSPIAMIRLAWPRLCGSALAAHTNPIALQAGELFVAASDDAWASALREVDGRITKNLIATFPDVLRIVIRTSPPRPQPLQRRRLAPPRRQYDENKDISHDGLRAACDGLAALRDATKDGLNQRKTS